MQITLNLNKYQVEELQRVFKKERRQLTQTEVKQWVKDKIHYHALMD
tara:strand:+ start:231 stop:371 length:141 start_codon:yes stop_codon:yes gene_type:complete